MKTDQNLQLRGSCYAVKTQKGKRDLIYYLVHYCSTAKYHGPGRLLPYTCRTDGLHNGF